MITFAPVNKRIAMRKKIGILYFILLVCVHALAISGGYQCQIRGIQYFNENNFAEAMRCFVSAVDSASRNGDTEVQVMCMGYLADIYVQHADYEHGILYYTKALQLAEANRDHENISRLLVPLIDLYCQVRDAKHAKLYLAKLEEMPSSEAMDAWRFNLAYCRANVARVEKRFDEARRQLSLGYEMLGKYRLNVSMRQLLELLESDLLIDTGDYEGARDALLRALDEARKENHKFRMVDIYDQLSNVYRELGDSAGTREYRTAYILLTDSLYDRRKFFEMSDRMRKTEERILNQQIVRRGRTITQQRMILAIVSILAIALIVVLVLVLKRRSDRRKDKEEGTFTSPTSQQATTTQPEVQDVEADSLQASDLGTVAGNLSETQQPQSAEPAEGEGSAPLLPPEQVEILLKRIEAVMSDIGSISNPDFSLQLLADTVNSNTKYVSMVINQVYQKNFKTLLNERRIEEACRRLLDTEKYGNIKIQAIYEEVGYTNGSSFIRAFRNVKGMTPSEFQKHHPSDTP